MRHSITQRQFTMAIPTSNAHVRHVHAACVHVAGKPPGSEATRRQCTSRHGVSSARCFASRSALFCMDAPTEADVGITEFASALPGFTGILKQRHEPAIHLQT